MCCGFLLSFFYYFRYLITLQLKASNFYTEAPHAIIMDVTTGEVLFEKDARVAMSPASMTKIMTAHMVFDALKDGVIDTRYQIPCLR